jgi:hypothetical protein
MVLGFAKRISVAPPLKAFHIHYGIVPVLGYNPDIPLKTRSEAITAQ